MVIDFELELAKLVTVTGTGKVIAKAGYPVDITDWGDNSKDEFFPIKGWLYDGFDSEDTWTFGGKYLESLEPSGLDLVLEVDDELWL